MQDVIALEERAPAEGQVTLHVNTICHERNKVIHLLSFNMTRSTNPAGYRVDRWHRSRIMAGSVQPLPDHLGESYSLRVRNVLVHAVHVITLGA